MQLLRFSSSHSPHPRKSPALRLAVLAATFLAFAHPAPADVPRGVFCLLPAGAKCSQTALSNPSVDGISIRQAWSDLEPTEGHYDWTYLDSEVARAAGAGKPVLLRILTQGSKPAWVTNAVTAAGGTFFSFDDGDAVRTTIPVFWDPTFLAKKKVMIAALGAHFGGNPAVKIVAINFANAASEDWNVPHTVDDVAAWAKVGYTTQKLLDTGKTVLDAAMKAFPTQYIALAVAGNGKLDPDVNYAARNAIATVRASYPGRLVVQKNSLAVFIRRLLERDALRRSLRRAGLTLRVRCSGFPTATRLIATTAACKIARQTFCIARSMPASATG
ncbi:MAG: beta-galactosidase [Chthoniobacterales bacterium]